MNEFFSIFNPDWWADENNNALQMTDAILYLLFFNPSSLPLHLRNCVIDEKQESLP